MENLIKFIERTSDYLTEEEKLWTFMDPLRIYQQSLYLEKRDGERICMFMDKRIKLSKVLFEALYKMAQNPNISHDLVDDCDSLFFFHNFFIDFFTMIAIFTIFFPMT